MTVDDIKNSIGTDAPALAALLGGPVSDVAMSALGVSLTGDAAAGSDKVGAALNGNGNGADPALKDKLKDAEAAAFAQLSAAAGDPAQAQRDAQTAARRLDEDYLADERDRIRAELRQAKARDWWINPILALLVTLGFFFVVNFILHEPTDTNNPVAQTLLGVLGTSWVAIISFYFGSSIGSKEKTALLADRAPGK
jgi:hypothetical protein